MKNYKSLILWFINIPYPYISIEKGKVITTCLCKGLTKEQGEAITNKLNDKYSNMNIYEGICRWFELVPMYH